LSDTATLFTGQSFFVDRHLLMHAYPPRGFDWQMWACPLTFTAFVLPVLVVLLWPGVRKWIRIFGLTAVTAAAFWFLLMLPKFQGAAEAAARTQCRNNLKVLAAAFHEFHNKHGRLPTPSSAADSGQTMSWRVTLLPFLGRENGGHDYDASKQWDDPANQVLAKREPPEVYRCRSNREPQDAQQRWFTAYAALTGEGTPFPPSGPLTLDEITDSTSQTILIVEACGRNVVWTEPRDVDVTNEKLAVNAPGSADGSSDGVLSSWHRGGAACVLADGSVRFVSENTSPAVLRALATAAGNDEVGEF
jgi:hypothetical protein